MMDSPIHGGLSMTPARTRFLILVLGLLGTLALASPASAKTCAETLIDDWADNAQIDRKYPVDCYRAAIQALPEDLRAYSSAADDIRRAQQELVASESGSGSGGTDGGTAAGDTGDGGGSGGSTGDERDPQASTQTDTLAGAPADEASDDGGSDGGAVADGPETTAAPAAEAFDEQLGDGGSSLPLPVVVLLAVAGAAALAVAGWLLNRQFRGRRPSGG